MMAYFVGQLIGGVAFFQGLLWIGNKIGAYLITHARLYRFLFRSTPALAISPSTLEVSNCNLKEFAKYARPRQAITDEHKIYVVRIYWHILLVVLIASLLLLASIYFVWFVLPLSCLNLFSPLRKFLRLRKRYHLDSQNKLFEDTREPILYLRSFYQDRINSDLEVGGFVNEFVRPGSNSSPKSPEERLVSAFSRVGPVVAIGKPKEQLPELGAIRFYFDDSRWQEKVEALMTVSQIVVIQAGHSQGAEWEMQTAMRCLPPERLVFSFVHWQALNSRERQLDYDIFRMQTKRIYGLNLPEKINGAYFMYFRADWIPRFACIKGWRKYLLSRKSTATISEAMKQVLNQQPYN